MKIYTAFNTITKEYHLGSKDRVAFDKKSSLAVSVAAASRGYSTDMQLAYLYQKSTSLSIFVRKYVAARKIYREHTTDFELSYTFSAIHERFKELYKDTDSLERGRWFANHSKLKDMDWLEIRVVDISEDYTIIDK